MAKPSGLNRHKLLDLGSKVCGLLLEALYSAPILRNEELGAEVPPNGAITPRLRLQEGVDWVLLRAIDLDLGHQHELGTVLLDGKLFDLCVRLRFLIPKLIAGESENLEPLLGVLAVDLNHALVLRVRRASERRDIHNHERLALEILHIPLIPIDVFRLQIVKV
eukprot:CAMPEP_0196739250 /NCGR_PEP_ID=MMETSP1091-20130531/20801_1 /TAXON_ID=302021 /ORGANISM="Rhodomonas sp., Strain CCMP768" /LENGTH=163 /DNA_ID=CAMNT_0042083665 /DNA_START=141 /DNA_END=632 /DNA_ORIENTATION=+